MNIAYIARLNLAVSDASTAHVFEFCRQFARLGHRITLFVPDMGVHPEFPGVSLVFVPIGLRRPWASFALFYLVLLVVFPWYWWRRKFELVYTRHQQLEWLVTWLKIPLGLFYVVEVNGLAPVEMKINGAPAWYIGWVRWMEGISFRLADALVCPSPVIRDALCRDYGLEAERICVVSNGADPALCRPMDAAECRVQTGMEPRAGILLFVGSLKPWHGIDRLVDIFPEVVRAVPDARLWIVGDGPQRSLLERKVARSGVAGSIRLAGAVSHEQVPLYINGADICLAPYFDPALEETGISPLKIFEYMACARPVVYTPAGGLDRAFEGREIGIAVPGRSPEAWIEPLIRLLRDGERRRRLGLQAYEILTRDFTWETICRAIDRFLQDRLTGR